MSRIGLPATLALLLMTVSGSAQFAPLKTTLQAKTEAEFQAYARKVEAELNERWSGQKPFLKLDEDAGWREKVMSDEVWIEASIQPNPQSISDGLIHDWFGAVYIPNTTLEGVLSVLQDFDQHAAIYPQVIQSHLVKRSGEYVTGYWRLEQKGQILPAVFDVTQTVRYRKVAVDKWTCSSHGDDIRAVEGAGSSYEKILPRGEGIGLIWQLYSYWSLQQTGSGVIAECRTLSLSRGMPASVAWMIRPFLNSVPYDSMESTLRNTRKAASK